MAKKSTPVANVDPIVDEIRSNRAELWTEYNGDMDALCAHAQILMKKYDMKMATLKPVAKSLKDLAKNKKRRGA